MGFKNITTEPKTPIAVLISGSGTNLQALIDACEQEHYPAKIVLVISNKADAYGLERASKAGIPTVIIHHKDFETREAFDQALDHAIKQSKAELVCLAGFMRLLTPWFNQEWHDRLINIHPSLLPAFKGMHAQQQALDAGVKITGCTVHFVRPETDSGPIIAQAAVEVKANDTLESLSARIREKEHSCYTEAVRLVASREIHIIDEKTLPRDQG